MGEVVYVEISCDNGDVRVRIMSREVCLDYLSLVTDCGVPAEYFEFAPDDESPQYWRGKSLLIKGKIVVPQRKIVVVEADVE